MKATLLEKVQTIEKEADDIVEKAHTAGEQAVETIRTHEQDVIEDIQNGATERGKKIVKERVIGMKDDISKITQESSLAAEKVVEAANKNRNDVLTKAQQLFNETYLK